MKLQRPEVMKSTFQITLPKPPSVNACYGTNWKTKRRFKTKIYEDWIEEAFWLTSGKRGRIHGKVKIKYEVGRHEDNRRRDVFNIEKPISDFLVALGVIEDDCLIDSGFVGWSDDVKQGEVRITVEEL